MRNIAEHMRQYLETCSSIALRQNDLSTSESIVPLGEGCYSSNRFVAKIFTTRVTGMTESR
jgi:hypothetical protein